MGCSTVREVLSADIDGEATPAEARDARAHLGTCDECAGWWAAVGNVNRLLRVRPAEDVPDLATAVLAQPRRAVAPRPRRGVRVSLGAFAVAELLLAATGSLTDATGSSVHGTQHLGSFAAAVAAGLLYVAWRPARAWGVLPIIGALVVTIPVFALIDGMNGELSLLGGLHHLVQLIGLALVWVLAGRPHPRQHHRWPDGLVSTRPRRLRSIPDATSR